MMRADDIASHRAFSRRPGFTFTPTGRKRRASTRRRLQTRDFAARLRGWHHRNKAALHARDRRILIFDNGAYR